jgi:hypothetical protein
MQQIRDLVHTIKSADLTPAQIQAAFGEIYLSNDTLENQLESQEIVEMMRVVKAPMYGTHIPNTGTVINTAGASGLTKMFDPETNRTYKILAVSVTNAGNVGQVQFGMMNSAGNIFACIFRGDVAATATTAFADVQGVTFDANTIPAFLIESGDVNDYNFEMAYCEIIQ